LRLKTEDLLKRKFTIIKIVLISVSLCTLIFGITLSLSAHLREFIITITENIVLRSINREYWLSKLKAYALALIISIPFLFFCWICFYLTRQKIVHMLQKVFLEARKLPIPEPVSLFAFLCLFLFLYVRLNINIMPIIVCWVIYRLGFINWLFKIFGKKETKTALFIAGMAMVFFIVVMLLFRVVIVMDLFFDADQNRVFYDFTLVYADHYRVKVHPFYVLLWQSLYHLFCPLVNKTSLAIRTMVCIFSALNCGIFSLFISRITKSRFLNVIISAIMIFSFPQIMHSSQILEAYIFAQSSVVLMLLYFSFAFTRKDYNLPALLALSLFITGNNIAYLCIFAIFYIILLYRVSDSVRTAWNKVLMFFLWYIFIFSILLLTQTLFYGSSAPSNIFLMIRQILAEEGNYISTYPISYTQYAKKFFNVILFYHLPFNIGALFNNGWIWALLLMIPVLGFKKIINKPLFIAIVVCCVFLFLFHRFYGYNELALYSPVIMCIYIGMFAFIRQVLPKKMTIFLCCLLLAIMIYFNLIGLYIVHCINQYVFGSVDIAIVEVPSIDMLNEHIKNYVGKIFSIPLVLQRLK